MDELVVKTVVYESQGEIYDFLVDFPRYGKYSKHLTDVSRTAGDGGARTAYAMQFEWWKLSYTAHSKVTDVSPPERIDWEITKDLSAHGSWIVEPLDELPDDAPEDAETACLVSLVVHFDPGSANSDALGLPRFISTGTVVKKAIPLVKTEVKRVFTRAVRDLEGRDREVELEIETDSEHL
ncbi:SRPBCC family protein [Haloferacaceae archaeon DSL9]